MTKATLTALLCCLDKENSKLGSSCLPSLVNVITTMVGGVLL